MPVTTSIYARLQYQHKSLLELIDGLTDEQIHKPVVAGKWSIFENIVHLSTYQHVFIQRIQKILKDQGPVFSRYTADTDPEFINNCSKSSREIMQDLLNTRKELSAEIQTYSKADINKTGAHPIYGKMNLLQWLNFFLLHEAHHLFTIFKQAAEIKRDVTN